MIEHEDVKLNFEAAADHILDSEKNNETHTFQYISAGSNDSET